MSFMLGTYATLECLALDQTPSPLCQMSTYPCAGSKLVISVITMHSMFVHTRHR